MLRRKNSGFTKMARRIGAVALATAMTVGTLQGTLLFGATEVGAAETITTKDSLKLWYDEPATAEFYEIFSSKFSFIEWYQDHMGNWLSKGDGWLEFGRSDSQNYTDGVNHSKSKSAPDGTWDVTDAVKQGVAWAKHALPVGNGNMGAMSFGYTDTEVVQMNQNTLWTGGPGSAKYTSSTNADSYGNTNISNPAEKMQKLIDNAFDEFYSSMESGAMPNNDVASPYANGFTPNSREQEGAYQSFCEMKLDFNQDVEKATDYQRSLDLNTAVSTVSYGYDGVNYTREMFASYPDNVIVYKVTASEKGKVNFVLHPEIPHKGLFEGRYNGTAGNGANHYGKEGTVVANGDTITLSGALNHNGMKFAGTFQVVTTGGTMKADNDVNNALASGNIDNGKITVSGADEAYIIVSLKTDYVNDFDKNYTTGETLNQVISRSASQVSQAAAKGYDQLYSNHEADYKELFDRVSLDIGGSVDTSVTTDELLDAYKENYSYNKKDSDYSKYLETLYYQYGRYLLIASSREGGLPANLQGLWNDTDGPSWNCDYHTNINLQMNYWLAESTNLAETAIPLVDFANSLRKPGRLTFAKSYGIGYNSNSSKIDLETEDGFVFFCSTNPLGFTGNINSNASFTQTATAFLGQNLYDYYAFTKDLDYLKSDIYPYLRESCLSYLQTLQPGRTDADKDLLYVAPSWSSEQGPWTVGTYFDQQLVWQVFHDTIQAMKDMGITPASNMEDEGNDTYLTNDSKLMARLQDAIERLDPVSVGADGQLKEWRQEVKYNKTASGAEMGNDGGKHRHVSQLVALYPGNYISKDDTEYINGVKKVLQERGDDTTGWGLAHRLNLWARTGDGEHAYDIVNALLATGTYDNLFDTHAPFQIDGNFGGTAGITEMLLQSHEDKVELLPSLPSAWASGSVQGIIARGNFQVDMKWANKKVTQAIITAKAGGTLVLDGIDAKSITDSSGKKVNYTVNEDGCYVVETVQGEKYLFTVSSTPDVEITPEPTKTPVPTKVPEPTSGVAPTASTTPTNSPEPVKTPAPATDSPKPTASTAPSNSPAPGTEEPDPSTPAGSEAPAPTSSAEPNPSTSTEVYYYGDVNLDKNVTAEDALSILKHVVKLTMIPEGVQLTLADVDRNESIEAADALETLKIVVKLREAELYQN